MAGRFRGELCNLLNAGIQIGRSALSRFSCLMLALNKVRSFALNYHQTQYLSGSTFEHQVDCPLEVKGQLDLVCVSQEAMSISQPEAALSL